MAVLVNHTLKAWAGSTSVPCKAILLAVPLFSVCWSVVDGAGNASAPVSQRLVSVHLRLLAERACIASEGPRYPNVCGYPRDEGAECMIALFWTMMRKGRYHKGPCCPAVLGRQNVRILYVV